MKPTHLVRTIVLAATVTALSYGPSATATVARYLELDEHAALSSLIVRASVGTEVRTFVGEDGMPRTETPLTIHETYKGSAAAGSRIWLRQLGEPDANGRRPVVGDPSFAAGEEVVVFLHGDRDGIAYLTALSQSKYRVIRDAGGPILVRELGDLAFYDGKATRGALSSVGDAPVSLEIFGAAIAETPAAAPSGK